MELHNEFRIIAMQRAIEQLPSDLVLGALRESVWQFYYQEISFEYLNSSQECTIRPEDYADLMAEKVVSDVQCFPVESIRKKAIDWMKETEKSRIVFQQELAKKWGMVL